MEKMSENDGIIHDFDGKWCNAFDLLQQIQSGEGTRWWGWWSWLTDVFTIAERKDTTSDNKNKVWAYDTTLYNVIYDQYMN